MEEKSLRGPLALSVSFGSILAALWLMGFWGAFDVSIFEFADLTDVLKLALYPAAGSFLLLFLAIGMVELFDKKAPAARHDAETLVKLQHQSERRVKVVVAISAALLLLVLTLVPEPSKWFLMTVIAGVGGAPVIDRVVPHTWVSHKRLRSPLLIGILLVPGMAFVFGREHGFGVKNGNADAFVDIERSELALKVLPGKPVAYLGHIGEFFVMYETSTGTVVFISAKEHAKLFLQHNPRHVMRVLG